MFHSMFTVLVQQFPGIEFILSLFMERSCEQSGISVSPRAFAYYAVVSSKVAESKAQTIRSPQRSTSCILQGARDPRGIC